MVQFMEKSIELYCFVEKKLEALSVQAEDLKLRKEEIAKLATKASQVETLQTELELLKERVRRLEMPLAELLRLRLSRVPRQARITFATHCPDSATTSLLLSVCLVTESESSLILVLELQPRAATLKAAMALMGEVKNKDDADSELFYLSTYPWGSLELIRTSRRRRSRIYISVSQLPRNGTLCFDYGRRAQMSQL